MSGDVNRTLWVGNLSEKVTDELLYELFLQAGPLDRVSIPKERDTGKQKSFAFVTFSHDVSVPYTIQLMDGVQLFGRTLRLQSRPGSVHQQQQQQTPQQINQGQFRNINNPYQNSHPMNSPNPHANVQVVQMNHLPPNPYMMNQPIRNQPSVMPHPPSFHRSHTWHGNDLSGVQQDRDREERKGNERDRDRHSNRDRDRSGSRRRDDRREETVREDYRNSPNAYDRNGNDDFESRRQKVLQKHDRMLQTYRRDQDSRPSPPYHNQRRGRY